MKRTAEVKWDDPVQLAQAGRSMVGIDFLRAIRDGKLPHPPICALLGYRLTEVEPGRAVFEITASERHYNPIGVVHGGIAMTLLDSAMGCAVQTQMPAGGAAARHRQGAACRKARRHGASEAGRSLRQALRARHEHVHRLINAVLIVPAHCGASTCCRSSPDCQTRPLR